MRPVYQGDYQQETVFSDDPLDVALKWQSMGAPRLHIVDLDGAATGEIGNLGDNIQYCQSNVDTGTVGRRHTQN